MRRLAPFALAVLLLACREDRRPVRLFTSTEVAGTGLPQLLAERFTAATGVKAELQVLDPRTLRAHDFGGRAAVILTNDGELLHRLEGETRLKAELARADFVVVGPGNDPAKVAAADTTPEAFRRIALGKRAFCSATDVPRYRAREAEIWKKAGIDPAENPRYRLCRGGMADLLRDAGSRRGYALVDEAALDFLGKADLEVLLEGKPMLQNDYWIILLDGRRMKNAEWFTQWVMSWQGREVVRGHRVDGERRLSAP